MINLLPPERSQSIRYGRINDLLLRWLAGLGGAIVVLIIILIGGRLYINQQSKNLQSDITNSQTQLTTQNLPQVQHEADEISGDLKVINQVLGSEVRLSDVLRSIGGVMPSGSILDGLTLTNVSGAIDLAASATDHTTAAQVAVNLSDPSNGLFSKVDIVSIDCPPGATTTYSCTVNLKVLFSNSAKTKFLGVAKAASNGQ
jgi:hypothetical protein